jgi:hypothetical protein
MTHSIVESTHSQAGRQEQDLSLLLASAPHITYCDLHNCTCHHVSQFVSLVGPTTLEESNSSVGLFKKERASVGWKWK